MVCLLSEYSHLNFITCLWKITHNITKISIKLYYKAVVCRNQQINNYSMLFIIIIVRIIIIIIIIIIFARSTVFFHSDSSTRMWRAGGHVMTSLITWSSVNTWCITSRKAEKCILGQYRGTSFHFHAEIEHHKQLNVHVHQIDSIALKLHKLIN